MTVIVAKPLSERGKKDARRHRDKQKEIIRKKLPEIIAEESIITGSRGKIIRIPIKSIDIPHFKPGRKGGQGGGVGQGEGQPGDVIGRRPGPGNQPGQPGQEPGQDYIDTEIEIEEIIAMMMEDLGLPNLQEKQVAELEVLLGIRITGIKKSGPWALLDRNRTVKEGMKRFWGFLRYLERETGRDEVACSEALKASEGRIEDALKLLQDPAFLATQTEVEPFPIFHNEDLRFLKIEENITHESNAVVFAMMDVSGSMTTEKKYFARSLLYWLVTFLRKIYTRVEVRFIIHHTEAKFVEEESFFKTGESGGTNCYSAYELANGAIDTEYPTSRWNVYTFHFSDGEDFSPEKTVAEIKKTIEKGVNMVGYGEIRLDSGSSWQVLWPAIEKGFKVEKKTARGLETMVGAQDIPLFCVILRKKEDIYPAIKEFLKKDRWLQ